MSRFGVRGLDGAPRQHRDQMRAVFGAAVQVAVQSLGRHGQTIEHLVREPLLQGLFERGEAEHAFGAGAGDGDADVRRDRKSTRLNSSHSSISYAVFCLKKKTTK